MHNNSNMINFRSLTALALIPFKITTTPELAGTVGVGVIEQCEDDDKAVVGESDGVGGGVGEEATGSTMTIM